MVPSGPLSPGGQGGPLALFMHKGVKKRPDFVRPLVLVCGGDFLLNFDLFGFILRFLGMFLTGK